MKLGEKTLLKTYLYKGKIINVRVDDVELPNGKTAKREIVEHNGGVGIIPIIGNDIYLIKQYRYAYEEELIEIPAGKKEIGEKSLETAQRELKEEIGASAAEYIYLGQIYPTVGYCSEKIDIYVAKGLSFDKQNLDSDEFLNVYKCPYNKALEMIKTQEIKDAKTIIGLLRVGEYFDKKTIIE